MIAAYVRVSSKSQNLATQRHAINQAAKVRGDKIERWYAEKVSTRRERPELDRLRNDARGGEISKLYVYRLDRLTRNGIRDTFALIDELKHCGCQPETVGDGFSLGGPGSEIVLAVLAWAAEREREATSDRLVSARLRVEASGRKWGRPTRITNAQREKIAKLRKQGKTWRTIAMSLKIPRSTVCRAGQ